MKVLATGEFTTKIISYNDQEFQNKLLKFIETLAITSNFSSLQYQFEISYNNIFVQKIDNYRVFFSADGVDGNTTVILVDFVKLENFSEAASYRNPLHNKNLNPFYNHSINPKFNSSLNPIQNNSINPNFNNLINPNHNTLINPAYNELINPQQNKSLNPNYNAAINPLSNSMINPNYNSSFDGYYLYGLNSTQKGFFIKANDNVLILYNFENKMTAFAVYFLNGFAVFDNDNIQTSYLISDNSMGFNQFDMNGNWIGYVK